MKRRVKLGPALDTTPEELDMLALVTPEDIEDAKATARQRMTPRGAALLEAARAQEEDNEPLPLGTD